jgi:16S rRNA (cytidine1402-2'-O)-methyltransferase
MHEEVFRGRISQAVERFAEPRGEFTLIIEGRAAEAKPRLTPDIEKQLQRLRCAGVTAKEAIAKIGQETGLPKRELYRAWLRLA